MSFGVKVTNGDDILLDDRYPTWKCDVRPNPKHFGLVRATVKNLPVGETEIFSTDHNKGYVPSFIVAWNSPSGNTPSGDLRQTFGIGILEATLAGYDFGYAVDSKTFKIIATNASGSQIANLYAEFRFYIFAEDFPLSSPSNFMQTLV